MKFSLFFILYFLLTFPAPLVFAEKYILETPQEKLINSIGFQSPNELNFYEFKPQYKTMNGAIVSVGTFRALHYASIGNFSEAYLFDHNKLTTEFNKEHLSLISQCTDRYDYFSRLYKNPDVGKAILKLDKGIFSHEKVQKILEAEAKRIPLSTFPNTDGYLYNIARLVGDKKAYRSSFLGNDRYFHRLKIMVHANKFFVVPGSLSGSKVMPWFAKHLREKKQEISVLDISNSMDYIEKSGQEKQFFTNLVRLPFAKNSRIQYTIDGGLPRRKLFYAWSYREDSPINFVKSHASFWHPSKNILNAKNTCTSIFASLIPLN